MTSPFPGMDPFIESRGLWRDFHDKLIADLERTLARLLPRRYAVRLDERTYIEWSDPNAERGSVRVVEPDVRVQLTQGRAAPSTASTGIAVAEPPTAVMRALAEVEEREVFLEIRDLQQNRGLVTCLEVLSPTNKRIGSEGWKAYSFKREWLLHGGANFVEIDLLRDGRRRKMHDPWPESPYYLLVARKETAPVCEVWAAFSTAPLPNLRVPLLGVDPDVVIDLQSIVDDIYERSRYFEDLRYDLPHVVSLRHDEAVLFDKFRQQQEDG